MITSFLPLLFLGWFESVAPARATPSPKPRAVAPEPPAYELRIEGERIWIRTDNTPLQTIFADLVRAGIKVRADPTIDAKVSGREDNMEIGEALEKILKPFGYILVWSVVPGPLGDLPRLEEVQVFNREGPRRLEPFMPDENFNVVRGPAPDSPEFIADEILLAVKPGTNIEQFNVMLAQIGGSVISSVPELGIYRIRLPLNTNVPALVEALKNQGIVSRVEPNYAYRLPAQPPETLAASAPTSGGATRAADGTPMVAVLDSGLKALSSLEGLIAGSYDAINPDRAVTDTAGHGTQMALIASGAVPPAGMTGGDAGVPVYAIRAFDDNGYTSNFTLMRAIEAADAQGARVINLSWGSSTSSSFLQTAVQQAQGQGMIVVASAGNEPTGQPVYPAAYPGVLSVSALTADGSAWSLSNYGTTVDLAAPGTATLPIGYDGPAGGYAGTSIAAAFVSRQLALYLAANPDRTSAEAERALMSAVTPLEATANAYGQGALDTAALERLFSP